MENGGDHGAAVEPPDDDNNSGGPHFTQTDPSGRFGRFDQVLGRGAFKVVYKAFDTQEGTEMAWNQVRVSEVMSAKDAENKEERDRLFAEIRVLKALKHKNIMSFYDSWYDPKTYTVNFITELFTSGTLRQYRKRHKHIDEEVVKRWAYQILCGLVYLHGHNPPIIHRDLKCDNIFINGSDGVVKIGDLGLATMLRSRTAPQSVLGTPEFMAPELYEEEYDDRVDVYSFGMCLLELSTMEYPYAECKNAAQIYRKVSLGVRPAGLQKVASGELTEFINVCISPRESRPRARQLLKHPYFDSIRRDKALASSRSEAALAAAAGGGGGGGGGADAGSDYGSATSGPVSRTASSLAEMMAAVGSASGISRGPSDVAAAAQLPPGVVLPPGSVPPVPGPPSASSSSGHPLSRTVSAEAHSERAGSDSASVRSQRSNASELAMAVLENIAEEAEGTDNGEDAVAAASGLASPGAAPGSRQASKGATPQGSPRQAPSSPAKPGSPTSSDGCRCDATERRFIVKGDWLDLDKRVQLRLRICEPSGTSRTVEFEFDLMVDTATNVAAEMVSDLELTPDDAAVIAATIRAELARLSDLPEINPHASMSLAQAAQAFERELTVNALEQAHNSTGSAGAPHHERTGSFGFQLHQHGRFADVESLGERDPAALAAATAAAAAAVPADVPPPARSPSPLPLPAAVAAVAGVPRPASFEVLSSSSTGSRRPSLEEQHRPVRRTEGSSASLASLSSASSIPLSVGSQPASEPGAALGAPPSLSRASPPPRPASTPAAVPAAAAAAAAPPAPLVAPAPSTTSSGAEGPPTRGLAPPPRPMSPLSSSSSGPSHTVPVDMPSPSQRVVRSNSVDAMSLLTRTSSMPSGREAVASPLGIGSGALSPSSTGTGILSPSVGVHEKRIPLHQLFANLEDLKASRADAASPGLEAAMAAAAVAAAGTTPTLAPPSLPPLPQPTGARGLPASNSGSALEGGGGSADMGLLRPRSEACLTMLPRQAAYASVPSLSAPTSAGALAAAVALAESTCPGSVASPSSTCSSVVSPRFAPSATAASAAAAADAIQRLDLQSSVPVPGAGLPVPTAAKAAALARRSAQVLSAPPSKLPSRDVSPAREGSLSPTRIPAGVAGDAMAHLNGKRPPIKDKEALRRQAADAMKAVELRSLNLLEGGLLGKGKDCRGVPMMAATVKAGSMGGMASQVAAAAAAAAAAAVAGPPAQGGMGTPMVPPPLKPQQPAAAQQQQPMGAGQAAAPRAPLPQQQVQQQAQQQAQQPAPAAPTVQPLQPQANGQPAPAPAAAAPAAGPQVPKPAVPKLAPPPGQPAVVLPPPPPTS